MITFVIFLISSYLKYKYNKFDEITFEDIKKNKTRNILYVTTDIDKELLFKLK